MPFLWESISDKVTVALALRSSPSTPNSFSKHTSGAKVLLNSVVFRFTFQELTQRDGRSGNSGFHPWLSDR